MTNDGSRERVQASRLHPGRGVARAGDGAPPCAGADAHRVRLRDAPPPPGGRRRSHCSSRPGPLPHRCTADGRAGRLPQHRACARRRRLAQLTTPAPPGAARAARRGAAAALLALLATCVAWPAQARYALDAAVAREIAAHAPAVHAIVAAATRTHAGESYAHLAELCDRFGPRLLGTAALGEATDYLVAALKADGLERVHCETVPNAPRWERGAPEAVTLTAPLLGGGRAAQLRVLALGMSVGTPAGGLEAEVALADSWEALAALGAAGALAGKVVLLNPPWRGYAAAAEFRVAGARRCAAHGAAAVLIRSAAPFGLATPHTGLGSDTGGATPIPAAAVAGEDADMLARMAARGWRLRVKLQLPCRLLPPAPARVVVAELSGTDLAHQTVLLSGHLDSWDVGYGALDDGGGLVVSWRALALLSRLGLRPRRTLRFVAWAGEEFGLGSASYWKSHAAEAGNVTLAAESDSGVFFPAALQLSAPVAAHAVARAVGELLQRAGAAGGVAPGGEGSDVSAAAALGVPVASLLTRPGAWFRDAEAWNASGPAGPKFQGDYFMAHHSDADTVSFLDPQQMDASLATWAAFAYVLANLSAPLPRGPPATAAQLAAELGGAASGSTAAPPPTCGPAWEPPEAAQGGGSCRDGRDDRSFLAAQAAVLALAAAVAGACAAYLLLVPGRAYRSWRAGPAPPVPRGGERNSGTAAAAAGGDVDLDAESYRPIPASPEAAEAPDEAHSQ